MVLLFTLPSPQNSMFSKFTTNSEMLPRHLSNALEKQIGKGSCESDVLCRSRSRRFQRTKPSRQLRSLLLLLFPNSMIPVLEVPFPAVHVSQHLWPLTPPSSQLKQIAAWANFECHQRRRMLDSASRSSVSSADYDNQRSRIALIGSKHIC